MFTDNQHIKIHLRENQNFLIYIDLSIFIPVFLIEEIIVKYKTVDIFLSMHEHVYIAIYGMNEVSFS